MSCGPTHYAGCACHEARWAAKLAAAESRAEKLETALERIGGSDAPCWYTDDCPDTEEPCWTCSLKRIARAALGVKP